ncbi:MAG: ribbon-helix-helix domain-containing protein [Silvibacterium sp.]
MPTPFPTSLKLDDETQNRVRRIAAARHQSPDSILRTAIEQYLEREEHPAEKRYPQRSPVGGIITPV